MASCEQTMVRNSVQLEKMVYGKTRQQVAKDKMAENVATNLCGVKRLRY